MAYTANELFSSVSVAAKKGVEAETIQPKTFGNVSGGPTILKGSPVAFNTSTLKWVVWANGGANGTGTIKGILWPDDVILDATNDVLGQVMIEGKIDINEITIPSGQTLANLKVDLQASAVREQGIFIEGLVNFR